MKNPLWSAVYELFGELDTLVSREERFEDRPTTGAAAPAPAPSDAARRTGGQAGFFRAYVAKDDLVEVRAKLRSRLDMLKASLAETLTERESFLVLFPLVIYFDELVQNRFVAGGGGGTWPPLQTELFQIDSGGAAFYETLDDLLRKPDTLPFVYEVFYLCLSSGFKGRHVDNLAQVEEYKSKLKAKIPVPEVPRKPIEARQSTSAFATSPVWIYAVAAGLIVSAYLLLGVIGRYSGA